MEPLPPARDPYASPGSPYAAGSGGGVTPVTIEALKETRPWVRLMGILGFIGSALIVLVSLTMFVGAGFAKQLGMAGIGLGFVYLCMAVLYIFPSLYLLRYAGAIQALAVSRSSGDLEQALLHQKSFWRFAGIMTVIVLCFYALALLAMLVFGVGAALLGRNLLH